MATIAKKLASESVAYESRKPPAGETFIRGINSIQLYHDGARYWIVLFW
ncbi:MAG: hypothetical protein ACC628_26175 [Pirellulaceae bacterium]